MVIAALLAGVCLICYIYSAPRLSSPEQFAVSATPLTTKEGGKQNLNKDTPIAAGVKRHPSEENETGVPGRNPADGTVPSSTPLPTGTRERARWESIAKQTRLQMVSSSTLSLTPAVAALLELQPEETEVLNGELRSFIGRLKAAELEHAYVLVREDGSEQIVVAPFDRNPVIKTFRDAVAAKSGDNVANFLAEQMRYDSTLATEKAEIRFYMETDKEGVDRVAFERKVRNRDPTDMGLKGISGRPIPVPTITLVTKKFATGDLDARYKAFFDAAPTLPRKTK